MKLALNTTLSNNYSSEAQKVRVMTEAWVNHSIFCPNCGFNEVAQYPNNSPAADFFCTNCDEVYELKSKKGSTGAKIVDGAYNSMIARLQESNNPSFFFLNYNLGDYSVKNFFVIPKHFFVPKMIEKRNPLASTAKRAGWVGCNILMTSIPETGKVFYVKNGKIVSKQQVLAGWEKTLFLRKEKISTKGWLLDIMRSIEKLGKDNFLLEEIYKYEEDLHKLHPENSHIRPKIRQQLQLLRDKGYLSFTTRGRYQLTR